MTSAAKPIAGRPTEAELRNKQALADPAALILVHAAPSRPSGKSLPLGVERVVCLSVFHILRVHLHCRLKHAARLGIPSLAGIEHPHQIVPLCIPVWNGIEQPLRLQDIAGLDHDADLVIYLLAPCVLLGGRIAPRRGIAPRASSGFSGKHIIGSVDFLHLFQRPFILRRIPVLIGVVFLCQLAIGLFDLFLACAWRYPQYVIRVQCSSLLGIGRPAYAAAMP